MINILKFLNLVKIDKKEKDLKNNKYYNQTVYKVFI